MQCHIGTNTLPSSSRVKEICPPDWPQVPRRAPAQARATARARVPHDGRVRATRGRRGRGALLRAVRARVPRHLQDATAVCA